jgi:hypothetical protein
MKNTALLSVALLASAVAAPFAVAADQPAAAAAPAATTAALPPVNHLVYLAKLPTPAALMKEAAEQGKSVERIDRTGDSIVVVYKYADGHTDSYGYTTLSAASTEEDPAVAPTAPVATTPAPATTVVTTQPATTVIYQAGPPVYYDYGYSYRYYRDPFYDFWGPLALGVGIGWISGGHGGYYHHYHGWRH